MVSGDRVTLAVEGNTVHTVNSAVYAMQTLQQEMSGEAEHTGLTSEDDITALVNELSWTFESNSKNSQAAAISLLAHVYFFRGMGYNQSRDKENLSSQE